ncbi:MAG: hypothetical protein A2Z42_01870 [Candidatus Woykebacteria bacterium RBG_19FT_COMBO_43_10]|uniref:Nudix hydrolase domain-containing protein n=1 Tax=Candidatus Woykebacteria bacterium RBG_19FT_COMBO_43_10 TaxID=1802598 RepID=A0A1G1WKQ8_9BACT|nr:MAG: hypothetical protein A2Z42_01870 [Candidatus Woykebacteria bacterium RBG_19FT_COMBO_43_10]
MPNKRAAYASEHLSQLLDGIPDGGRILSENLPYGAVVGWPEVRSDGNPGLQTRFVIWPGAMAIALDEVTHEVYVVYQTREVPGTEIVTVELPGGGIDPDDTPFETASKELLEETGVVATDRSEWIQLLDEGGCRPIDGLVWTSQHAFLLINGRKIQEPADGETTTVATLPLSKLIDIDNQNGFKDPLSPYFLRRAQDWLKENRPDLLT